MWQQMLYITALVVIATTTLLAVFSERFTDNLLQRLGLSLSCGGAILHIVEVATDCRHYGPPRDLLTYGVALFAAGTFWKFYRKKHTP